MLAPASALYEKTGGKFKVWFYTHDNSIRGSDKWIVRVSGMRSDGMRDSYSGPIPACLGSLLNRRQKRSQAEP